MAASACVLNANSTDDSKSVGEWQRLRFRKGHLYLWVFHCFSLNRFKKICASLTHRELYISLRIVPDPLALGIGFSDIKSEMKKEALSCRLLLLRISAHAATQQKCFIKRKSLKTFLHFFFFVHLPCILDYTMTNVQLNLSSSVLQFSVDIKGIKCLTSKNSQCGYLLFSMVVFAQMAAFVFLFFSLVDLLYKHYDLSLPVSLFTLTKNYTTCINYSGSQM